MRTHLTSDGPKPCDADKQPCPYSSGEHFDSKDEAQQEYERRQNEVSLNKKNGKLSKPKLSQKEKELVNDHNKLLKDFVSLRKQMGDVTFDDANEERAERRIQEAIDFASSRGNSFLTHKLKTAKVLPSGAFKTSNGQRVNTDSELKKNAVVKNIDEERGRIMDAANELLRNENLSKEKYSLKTQNGSFTMSVGQGINKDEFEKLNEKTKQQCMSPVDSFNVDHAREILPKEKFDAITRESQVFDVINGKASKIDYTDADVDFEGSTGDEKANSVLTKFDSFYGEMREKHGILSRLKKDHNSGKEAIKAVAAKHKGNTFAPARSQKNGAIVSTRLNVNAKSAKETLTQDEFNQITTQRMEPDADKAKLVLNKKSFDKIFNARKISVRFNESKE